MMMSDHELRFTWQSPGGHMLGSMMSMMVGCPVTIQGIGHLQTDASGRESIRGTYDATSQCSGPVEDGQFLLQRK